MGEARARWGLVLALTVAGCGAAPRRVAEPVDEAPAGDVVAKMVQNQKRLCLSNQKMISGAFTMLELDDPGAFGPQDVGSRALFERLRAKGYAQTIPEDPGQGPESYGNYSMDSDGKVTCRVHGS